MALERITGKTFGDLFDDTFVNGLELTGTYRSTPPDDSKAIIPVNSSISWYSADLRGFGPAGGHFSTINDMRKIGKAIMNSTQLSAASTRKWMKPAAFTSDAEMLVGAPWEIFKAPINRTSWIYTKSGDLGLYSNNMIILPEYDIGISIMTAGLEAPATSRILSDIVATSFVPAFEQGAKEEAVPAYAGVYTDEKTNSSMKLDILEDEPGLKVTEWSFGGVDVFPLLA
jgi:CubicO group peptidase (beta-lactamase class C family)